MPSLAKNAVREIVSLRKRGHSLPEIRKITRHSNGTVFKYIQGVQISPKFIERWKERRKPSVFRKAQLIRRVTEEARILLQNITSREKVLLATALYWAEGAKKDFALINSDPDLIKIFIQCLRSLGIRRGNLSMTLRIYEDLDQERVTKFWLKTTGLLRSQIISTSILDGKERGKLQYGMCRIRVIKGNHTLKLVAALRERLIKLI